MKTVLTIDGTGHDLVGLRKLLEKKGYNVETVAESTAPDASSRTTPGISHRAIFENAPLGIFRATCDVKPVTVNPALARMFKYDSPEQMMDLFNLQGLEATLCPGKKAAEEAFARVRQSGDWEVFEGRYRCKDGSYIDCCVRLRGVPGTPDQIEGFVEDITGRKRADELLRLTQYVVDQTADQAFWLDKDGRVFYVNEAACRALGYSREELIGMSVFDFDPVYSVEEFKRGWERARIEGSRVIETLHRSKDGRVYPVEVRVNRVQFDGKEYHCTFVSDISERKATENILRESEKRYRQLMEILPIAAYTTDAGGKITFFNSSAAQLWGRKPGLQRDRWSGAYRLWYPDGKPMSFDACPMALTLKHGKRYQGQELLIEKEQGGCSHVVAYPEPLYDNDGRLIGALNLLVDISARKRAEAQLLQANLVVENSPVVLFRWKAEPGWPVVLVSRNITRYGYDPEEFLSGALLFASIIHPGDRERVAREVALFSVRGDVRFEQEYRILGKGGKVCWISDQTIVERDEGGQITHYQGIVIDITERKQAEELIKASLVEKEVLLKEIHHRVKNNLQVVSSLLYLQSQKFRDPEVKKVFAESQSRISSMAMAHEQLYRSKNLSDIDLKEYVHSLVTHVRQTFMPPGACVNCDVHVDVVDLDIEKVIPCGLLITELLSNALKHAFSDGRCGTIKIDVYRQKGRIFLSVSDDGIGLPDGFDYRNANTLGLQLVMALVGQLDGTLTVKSRNGTRFDISFPGSKG
jgi:PAS domain S-box-containing protein